MLTSGIYAAIERTPPGVNGEVQLTDALARMAREGPVFASTFRGTRYDLGDRFLWLRTNLEFAMRVPELRARLRPGLEKILREAPQP